MGSAASEARRQVVPQAERECEHRASDNRRHDEGQHNTENRYEGLAAEVRGRIKEIAGYLADSGKNRQRHIGEPKISEGDNCGPHRETWTGHTYRAQRPVDEAVFGKDQAHSQNLDQVSRPKGQGNGHSEEVAHGGGSELSHIDPQGNGQKDRNGGDSQRHSQRTQGRREIRGDRENADEVIQREARAYPRCKGINNPKSGDQQ